MKSYLRWLVLLLEQLPVRLLAAASNATAAAAPATAVSIG